MSTPLKPKKIPQRKCSGCKEMKDFSSLIRISCDIDGNFAIDTGKKKSPGRGTYICRNSECLAKAQKTKGLERSLKRAVPAEIYAQLEQMLN